MYIHQLQLGNLQRLLQPNKAVLIYGPRQCGKTTLIKKFLESFHEKYLFMNGDDILTQQYLSSGSADQLKTIVGGVKMLVIDEAQKIPHIVHNLKLMLDTITDLKIIATGSSAFELAEKTAEPLTGRKTTLRMFPLSLLELYPLENRLETKARMENRLIYGLYPEIVLADSLEKKETLLIELVNSYLYRDILMFENIRHSDKIVRLLQLLAFQLGSEVSCTELGQKLGMSKNTVERYLDLLEKAFVIFRLNGFSRNLRNEIVKNPKYYFIDNGVRNSLIRNFKPLTFRDDSGGLWENFMISERLKKQAYQNIHCNNYFWRTYEGKEIDLIEESGGKLAGFEFKINRTKVKAPASWLKAYPDSEFHTISSENYFEFL